MSSENVAEKSSVWRLDGIWRNESHVEHSVGLVEDQDLDLGEIHGALPDVIEQAARCGDQDLDAPPEELDLGVDPSAAVNDRGAECAAAAVCLHCLGDLDRQLARGGEDEDSDGMPRRREACVGGVSKAFEDRQDEGGGLAGAGLGGGKHIAAVEDEWNRRALYGRRLRVALSRDCGE